MFSFSVLCDLSVVSQRKMESIVPRSSVRGIGLLLCMLRNIPLFYFPIYHRFIPSVGKVGVKYVFEHTKLKMILRGERMIKASFHHALKCYLSSVPVSILCDMIQMEITGSYICSVIRINVIKL